MQDPSCSSYSQALLYFKGFHALQTHRIAHSLWHRGHQVLALMLQSRVSEVFAVDIHPAARIGRGVMLDQGTGVVIGETAVIGDNCSLLQVSASLRLGASWLAIRAMTCFPQVTCDAAQVPIQCPVARSTAHDANACMHHVPTNDVHNMW
jgi:hypothetical protein